MRPEEVRSSAPVLSSCCGSRVPLTGQLANNGRVCLTVLEAGKSRVAAPGSHLVRTSWFTDGWLFTVSSRGRRRGGSLWGLSYKDTDPILPRDPS